MEVPSKHSQHRSSKHAGLHGRLSTFSGSVGASTNDSFALATTFLLCSARAKSAHLTKPLRKIAGLCFATGSRVSVRWAASELNVADEPSRAIAAWKSPGWERWWNDFEKDVDYRPRQPGPFSHSQQKPPTESAEKAEGQGSHSRAAFFDLPGNEECEAPSHQRLPEKIAEVHPMYDSGRALAVNDQELNWCLVEFMNEMFERGEGIDTGVRTHAALRFFYPHIGRPSTGTLPRSIQALKRWTAAARPCRLSSGFRCQSRPWASS